LPAGRFVIAHRAAPAVAALVFLGGAAACGASLRFLHDEGIFTLDMAAALPSAPLAVLFLLKAKAVLAILYALPARAGAAAYLAAHAAIGAATIPLVVAAARRLGLPSPNLAGWALATSVGFFVASASGFANSDGAFFLALFLWLYAGERRVWAALVLGALPFIRFELTFAVAVILGFDLWRRRDARFAATALAFPIAYVVAGALYHRDVLWLLHTLSNRSQPADVRRYASPTLWQVAGFILTSAAVNFSVLGLVGVLGWDRNDRRLLPLFVAVAGTYLILIGLAAYDVGVAVDRSLRYHVAPLPLVALLAASWRVPPTRATWLVAVQALAMIAALTLTGFGREQHLQDHQVMSAVRANPLWRGRPIYTDIHIARYDRCAGVDAWMIANESIVAELDDMLARNRAQRDALAAALERQRFLIALPPIRRDALYLIESSARGRRARAWIEAAHPTVVELDRYRLYGWASASASASE
jgi:hypothetical protein